MSTALNQMIILFLMIAVGYAANKCGIMGRESERWLSRLIINITCPALIISSVTTSQQLENKALLLVFFVSAAAYYILMPFLTRALAAVVRIPESHRADFRAMLTYSNMGFMGIPVISAILGDEAVLHISIFMAAFNVSMFSYGFVLLQDDAQRGGKLPLARVVNAGTICALLSVTLYACNIQLPTLLLTPISAIGGITTPLAMLVIGSSLANYPFLEMFREKELFLFTAVRLLVMPAIALLLGFFLIHDAMLLNVTVLISAMPAASNVVMLCNELGRDGGYVSKGIFVSTLLSVVSIPMVAAVLDMLVPLT